MNNSSNIVMQIAAQVIPFVHVALACAATAVILRKRNEMSWALVIVASLVAWVIPLFGPISVLVGLRRPPAVQP